MQSHPIYLMARSYGVPTNGEEMMRGSARLECVACLLAEEAPDTGLLVQGSGFSLESQGLGLKGDQIGQGQIIFEQMRLTHRSRAMS